MQIMRETLRTGLIVFNLIFFINKKILECEEIMLWIITKESLND